MSIASKHPCLGVTEPDRFPTVRRASAPKMRVEIRIPTPVLRAKTAIGALSWSRTREPNILSARTRSPERKRLSASSIRRYGYSPPIVIAISMGSADAAHTPCAVVASTAVLSAPRGATSAPLAVSVRWRAVTLGRSPRPANVRRMALRCQGAATVYTLQATSGCAHGVAVQGDDALILHRLEHAGHRHVGGGGQDSTVGAALRRRPGKSLYPSALRVRSVSASHH
jgi:hypothetical protein